MTSLEKIQMMKGIIAERVEMSPVDRIEMDLRAQYSSTAGTEPDFSVKDQIVVLKKLAQQGFIDDLKILEKWHGFTVSMYVVSNYVEYLDPIVAYNPKAITIGKNTLEIVMETGVAILNKVKTTLNPKSQEFEILAKLISSKDHFVRYEDILGKEVSKTSKRNLTFVVRNLKESLGILPLKTAKNKDIIENVKGVGYKLVA